MKISSLRRVFALAALCLAGTVGFALTILQRRLASSPEAISQSLRRRRERLEKRLRELELMNRGAAVQAPTPVGPVLDQDDVEDLEEAPENEIVPPVLYGDQPPGTRRFGEAPALRSDGTVYRAVVADSFWDLLFRVRP